MLDGIGRIFVHGTPNGSSRGGGIRRGLFIGRHGQGIGRGGIGRGKNLPRIDIVQFNLKLGLFLPELFLLLLELGCLGRLFFIPFIVDNDLPQLLFLLVQFL